MANDQDILSDAKEAFELAQDHEAENREAWKHDIEFSLMDKQWPPIIERDRLRMNRPCLTINMLAPHIRQVVNDLRLNKPGIEVIPINDTADPDTAKIIAGIIRGIEYNSNAEVAYIRAAEQAVAGGFGYFKVNTAYTSDDTFDQDIVIESVAEALSIFGDPNSDAADSSDWMSAFDVHMLSEKAFQTRYKGAEKVDWDAGPYSMLSAPWRDGGNVMVAAHWLREEVQRKIIGLSDGSIVDQDDYKKNKKDFDAAGIEVITDQPRTVRSFKVTQYLLSGAEVLDKIDWKGKYIPIIPVYGNEVWLEGKRYLRSMIRSAKDAQRMFNYWRTTATELVALAPRAPFIGPKGAFKTDADKWASANTENHAYIEYDGTQAPQRQPFEGVPAGALQEAVNASDDIKAIVGMFDASLGANGNEITGKAIRLRQQEGDVSNFNFIDNLKRGIKHGGRVIVDLFPHVYSAERTLHVIGADGKPQKVPVNQPIPQINTQGQPVMQAQPNPIPGGPPIMTPVMKTYDLTVGKYDVAIKSGPSFTTQREQLVDIITDLCQAFPPAAPFLGPVLLKNLDVPGLEDVAEQLQQLANRQAGQPGGADPQVQELIQAGQQQIQKLTQELQQCQQELVAIKQDKTLDQQRLQVDMYKAETERMELDQRHQAMIASVITGNPTKKS